MNKANELKYATRAAHIATRPLRAFGARACRQVRFKYCN